MTHATGRQYLKPGILPHMWCAGCGIGSMLGALLRAFEELQCSPTETVVVTGIGCTGKLDRHLWREMAGMPCKFTLSVELGCNSTKKPDDI